MKFRILDQDEVERLGLYPHEPFAVINKETEDVLFTGSNKEACEKYVYDMGEEHPDREYIELVKQPYNEMQL
jgi:hypothetical protein